MANLLAEATRAVTGLCEVSLLPGQRSRATEAHHCRATCIAPDHGKEGGPPVAVRTSLPLRATSDGPFTSQIIASPYHVPSQERKATLLQTKWKHAWH